jgi:hypothetical protein
MSTDQPGIHTEYALAATGPMYGHDTPWLIVPRFETPRAARAERKKTAERLGPEGATFSIVKRTVTATPWVRA